MAYLFYYELRNIGEYDTAGNYKTGFSSNNSMGPFENIYKFYNSKAAYYDGWYWSGTDIPPFQNYVKVGFNFGLGRQYGGGLPGDWNHAWAVRDCPSCTVVFEPISSTLFIVGGATLGFRRFRKKFKK